MIIDIIKGKLSLNNKKEMLYNFLMQHYKDISESSGLDIPYFLKASQTLKEMCNNRKTINYYYKKLKEWKSKYENNQKCY